MLLLRAQHKGQAIIILALLYLTIILQLTLIIPKTKMENQEIKSHIQLINLIIKRCIESSLSWASLGGNFTEYLQWSLNQIMSEYSIIIEPINYTTIIREGKSTTQVKLSITDFKYNVHYAKIYNSTLTMKLINLETSNYASIPILKSIKITVKIENESGPITNKLNFTLTYNENGEWKNALIKVNQIDQGIYLISTQIPKSSNQIKLIVGDWREIITWIKIEI